MSEKALPALPIAIVLLCGGCGGEDAATALGPEEEGAARAVVPAPPARTAEPAATPTRSSEARGRPPFAPEATSQATAADGSTYVAGLFRGTATKGAFVLESREPFVKVADGRVVLMARTRGEVDCGSGPLATWSSPMFFLCEFGTDGRPLTSGTFPTGQP
jgi:hypothetical protein